MRTILFLLIFSSLTSFAQNDTIPPKPTVSDSLHRMINEFKNRSLEHFTFMDITINGSLNQFVDKLKKQGFSPLVMTKEDALLTGKFTGENVDVFIQASTKVVYSVTVKYNEQISWKAIKSQYDNMKSVLIAKYGRPIETIEEFDSPHSQESGLELYALSEDKCTYMTHFLTKTGNGLIRLQILSDAGLAITYVDTINYLLVSKEAYDDL